jgi:hypothetical protein
LIGTTLLKKGKREISNKMYFIPHYVTLCEKKREFTPIFQGIMGHSDPFDPCFLSIMGYYLLTFLAYDPILSVKMIVSPWYFLSHAVIELNVSLRGPQSNDLVCQQIAYGPGEIGS